MQIEKTPLADCYIIKPQVHHDHRGLFFESFNALKFKELTGLLLILYRIINPFQAMVLLEPYMRNVPRMHRQN